jgi:hypothetical protein
MHRKKEAEEKQTENRVWGTIAGRICSAYRFVLFLNKDKTIVGWVFGFALF